MLSGHNNEPLRLHQQKPQKDTPGMIVRLLQMKYMAHNIPNALHSPSANLLKKPALPCVHKCVHNDTPLHPQKRHVLPARAMFQPLQVATVLLATTLRHRHAAWSSSRRSLPQCHLDTLLTNTLLYYGKPPYKSPSKQTSRSLLCTPTQLSHALHCPHRQNGFAPRRTRHACHSEH